MVRTRVFIADVVSLLGFVFDWFTFARYILRSTCYIVGNHLHPRHRKSNAPPARSPFLPAPFLRWSSYTEPRVTIIIYIGVFIRVPRAKRFNITRRVVGSGRHHRALLISGEAGQSGAIFLWRKTSFFVQLPPSQCSGYNSGRNWNAAAFIITRIRSRRPGEKEPSFTRETEENCLVPWYFAIFLTSVTAKWYLYLNHLRSQQCYDSSFL